MSGVYGLAQYRLKEGLLVWSTADIRCVLLTSGYTFSEAHQYLSEVASGVRLGTSGSMTGKATSSTTGHSTGTVPQILEVAASTISAVLLYVHTGTESTSALLAYYNGFTPVVLSVRSHVTVSAARWL